MLAAERTGAATLSQAMRGVRAGDPGLGGSRQSRPHRMQLAAAVVLVFVVITCSGAPGVHGLEAS